jgi:hypothetical protein
MSMPEIIAAILTIAAVNEATGRIVAAIEGLTRAVRERELDS